MSTADDERIARELQQAELSRAGGGGGAGAPPAGSPPVVRGVAVSGPGGAGYQPGQAPGPVAYGLPGPGGIAVVVEQELPKEEVQVLSYRCSLKCFACVDAASTLFNTLSVIMASRISADSQQQQQEGGRGSGIFGYQGAVENDALRYTIMAVTGLVFLVGPICGFLGAQKLNRSLTVVYLAFCVMKAVYQVSIAVLSPHLWLILIAAIQFWVAKIVYTFWRALGLVTPARLEELKRPEFMGAQRRIVYW